MNTEQSRNMQELSDFECETICGCGTPEISAGEFEKAIEEPVPHRPHKPKGPKDGI